MTQNGLLEYSEIQGCRPISNTQCIDICQR